MSEEKRKVPKLRFPGFTEDWKQCKANSVLDFSVRGNSFSRDKMGIEDGEVFNIHYGDILIKYSEILNPNTVNIPIIIGSKASDYDSYRLKNGDVIFTDAAEDLSVGKATELINVNDKIIIAGLHTIVVRPLTKFSSGYLGYYFNSKSYRRQILPLIQGSKVSSINRENLSNTVIYSPQLLAEQKQISDFLYSFDKLLTLHQRKLENLKNLKKGLLQKLFPKNGETKAELRFPGFTDDWKQCKLGDLSLSFEYGLNVAAKEYDGENKYIRITDINDDTRVFNQSNLTSPDIDLSLAKSYKLVRGDILFARTGASVGKSYIYRNSDGCVYYAGFLIRVRIKTEYSPEFVFQNTLTADYDKFIQVTSMRSGQPGVNAQEYSKYPIKVPSLLEQQSIGNYFCTLDNLITLHQRKQYHTILNSL